MSTWGKVKSILGLTFSLTKAKFKLRNEGSFLGVLWYLLDPLAFFLILSIIRLNTTNKSFENYGIYLLVGLIIFNFFRGSVTSAISSISGKSNIIKSMKINLEPLVISSNTNLLISHFFEIFVIMLFMIYYNLNLLNILWYPIILIPLIFFNLGVSFIFSIIGVYVNDFKNIWAIVSRLLWFLTPIFYEIEKGTLIHKLNLFNPLYYFIKMSREIFSNDVFPSLISIISIFVFSIVIFLIGIFIFEINEDKLAENTR
ncbi:ABC transporter permease [Candidatus Woesearchaeota archaeon]|nr:ABC transporter permease [Candidatus Woesearchaeota archaeon]